MARTLTLVAAAALLALGACGGGGNGLATTPDSSFNDFEASLVGTYALVDFSLFCEADGSCTPPDLEEWTGTLELEPTGRARLRLRFCETSGAPSRACDRAYAWSADAGVIHLAAEDAGAPNHLLVWEKGDFGHLGTEVYVPINRPDVDFVTVERGREHFDWLRIAGS